MHIIDLQELDAMPFNSVMCELGLTLFSSVLRLGGGLERIGATNKSSLRSLHSSTVARPPEIDLPGSPASSHSPENPSVGDDTNVRKWFLWSLPGLCSSTVLRGDSTVVPWFQQVHILAPYQMMNYPKDPWTLLRRGRSFYNKGLYPQNPCF